MRITRLIRNRKRRYKKGTMELDITSLLDILVILLVFLLKSFNSSGVVFNISRDIDIPKSESISNNTSGVIVQVSTEKIWVDDKIILNSLKKRRGVYDHQGRRIIPLYNELVNKKEVIQRVQKSSRNAKKFSGIVNLIVDKTIKYNYMKKLLYTCAEAGFKQYKFIVMNEQN